MTTGETHGTLTQLRAFLANHSQNGDARLPPERQLAESLGVSRGTLRRALAELEAEGVIWRHVGRGTFLGDRPVEPLHDLTEVLRQTSPAMVMAARLSFEPELARLAALHATDADLDELAACVAASQAAADWRAYEFWDNQLHRSIAQASGNRVLLALFDSLNTIRRAVTWGRLRPGPQRPAADHHSFAEHAAIVAAIGQRDGPGAAAAMGQHLASVRANLLAANQPPGASPA